VRYLSPNDSALAEERTPAHGRFGRRFDGRVRVAAVEVSAPGFQPWRREVGEEARASFEVVLLRLGEEVGSGEGELIEGPGRALRGTTAGGAAGTRSRAKDDESALSGIFGRIVDADSGEPLDQVAVDVGERRGAALTTGNGFFSVEGLKPGPVQVRFHRLGYASRTDTLVLGEGRAGEVTVRLATRPVELAPLEVSVRPTLRQRRRAGFERRRELGFGTFFTRDDIEATMGWLGDALRHVPSTTVLASHRMNEPFMVRFRGGTCVPLVFVDGVNLPGWDSLNLRQIPAVSLESIEVYRGGEVPAEFYLGQSGCLTVVAWTR
jgi:hypothetical protein